MSKPSVIRQIIYVIVVDVVSKPVTGTVKSTALRVAAVLVFGTELYHIHWGFPLNFDGFSNAVKLALALSGYRLFFCL